MSSLKEMINHLPQIGRLEWIGLRTKKKGRIEMPLSAEVSIDDGLVGDHYSARSGDRQITLIQAEHLGVIASLLPIEAVEPERTRRNLVVSGINLLALKNQQFRIGDSVVLEMTGHCHPCTRMEKEFGPGGYNTMRGHGGITARVISGGIIAVANRVVMFQQSL